MRKKLKLFWLAVARGIVGGFVWALLTFYVNWHRSVEITPETALAVIAFLAVFCITLSLAVTALSRWGEQHAEPE